MTTKILADVRKREYESFLADLRDDWSVHNAATDNLSSAIKPMHKTYVSLACAATITAQNAPRNEYLKGLIEASYLSLVLAAKGIETPCCVLLRQSIELLLKHIYFSTHPVEYGWAKSRESYKDLTYQYLLEYIRRIDEISMVKSAKSVIDRLDYYYGIFSRYVHVHSGNFIGYLKPQVSRGQCLNVIGTMGKWTKEFWPLLAVILIASMPKKYLSASAAEQSLIRNGLPKKYRQILDGCLKGIALTNIRR